MEIVNNLREWLVEEIESANEVAPVSGTPYEHGHSEGWSQALKRVLSKLDGDLDNSM